VDRLCRPIAECHSNDFCALLLTALIDGEVIAPLLYAVAPRIPVGNYIYVLIILTFELRGSGRVPPDTPWAKFFPDSTRATFYSIYALEQVFSLHLEGKIAQFAPKRNVPSREFLTFRDQTALSAMTSTLNGLSARFRERQIPIDQFSRDVLGVLQSNEENIDVIEVCVKKHNVSLQIHVDGMNVLGEILGGAIAVAADFLEPARADVDARQLLRDIANGISTGVRPPEACFLAEAFNLLQTKTMSTGKMIQTAANQIEAFERALLGFEDGFQKNIQHKSAYHACIAYPKQREQSLANPAAKTGQCLIAIEKALSYVKYLMTASLVDLMLRAEYIGFLRVQKVLDYDPADMLAAVDLGMNSLIDCSQGMNQKFYKKVKGLPFLSGDLAKLQLDEDTPPWPFHPGLRIEGATPAYIDELKKYKVECYKWLGNAGLCARTVRLCTRCRERNAVVICDKCKQFVLCRLCSGHVCGK
jgi:hypothetical protein